MVFYRIMYLLGDKLHNWENNTKPYNHLHGKSITVGFKVWAKLYAQDL